MPMHPLFGGDVFVVFGINGHLHPFSDFIFLGLLCQPFFVINHLDEPPLRPHPEAVSNPGRVRKMYPLGRPGNR